MFVLRVKIAVLAATLFAGAASAQVADFNGQPVADDALAQIAGREDIAPILQSRQAATVADNRVGNNVTTGAVRIDDNAFQNLSGLAVINANTGNNVAINAAMTVNISINPVR